MTLDQLGLKYRTDKSSHDHDYCRVYEKLLTPLPPHPFNLLEIGVAYGASLRMWADWLPQARIIGLDNESEGPCWRGDPPRIQVIVGNQSNPNDLDLLRTYGPFHFIIDDGGHMPKQHLIAFENLWPALTPGGWYVIEDLPTLFWPQHRQQSNILDLVSQRLENIIQNDDPIQEVHILAGSKGHLTCDGLLAIKKRLYQTNTLHPLPYTAPPR